MAFSDMFKGNEYKQIIEQLERENAALQEKIARLEPAVNPTYQAIEKFEQERAELVTRTYAAKQQLQIEWKACSEMRKEYEAICARLKKLNEAAREKEAQIVTYDEELLVQEFGLYESRLPFATSSEFKDRMTELRKQQKAEVKSFNESLKKTTWQVNNSVAQGRKMIGDVGRLLMRAYNSECDAIISKVKYSNIDRSIKQVRTSAERINKHAGVFGITLPASYVNMKEFEARLAFEWAQQKEREKEELREARAREREARKLEREIAAERKKLEKEKRHYLSAYKTMVDRLKSVEDEGERNEIVHRISELEEHLGDIEKACTDIDYREANQRAGFVCVISNIGSFGKDVYKIGMTRRLDPMERVRELSDASVPFNFDVHALIFSDDAPALEAALHKEFDSRKVNLVNHRREFFSCTLKEIEDVVKRHYDKTVEFVEVPDAEQYRVSTEMRKQIG